MARTTDTWRDISAWLADILVFSAPRAPSVRQMRPQDRVGAAMTHHAFESRFKDQTPYSQACTESALDGAKAHRPSFGAGRQTTGRLNQCPIFLQVVRRRRSSAGHLDCGASSAVNGSSAAA